MSKPTAKMTVFLPGTEEWVRLEGAPGTACQPSANGKTDRGPAETRVGLPSRWFTSLFLNLQVPDNAKLKDMLLIQLERNDLPSTPGQWDYLEIDQQEKHHRIHLFALPQGRRQGSLDFPDTEASGAGPAWQFYHWEGDALVVQKELGRWTLLVIQKGKVAMTRDLATREPGTHTATALHQAVIQMQTSGALQTVPPVHVTEAVCAEFLESLQKRSYTVYAAETPQAVYPKEWKDLAPVRVEQTREAIRRRRTRKFLIMGASFFAVICCLTAAAIWFTNHRKVNSMNKELALLAPQVDTLMKTDARWEALKIATAPTVSPLETLHRITEPLPPEGIRITKFEQANRQVVVSGEARQATLVFSWVKSMKESDSCAHIQWLDPSVKMLPGNVTQFTLQGTLEYAPD